MKYILKVLLPLIFVVQTNAGLVNWDSLNFATDPNGSTISAGDTVALYIDVNGDSGLTGLVLNLDYTVDSINSLANMADDVFTGFTTNVISPFPGLKAIASQEITVTPDNALIYTVIFDSVSLSTSTLGLISDDSPFDSGSAGGTATPVSYGALGSDGILTGSMGGVSVIPEPTTIAVLLMGILGLVQFRKHLRK